MRFRTSSSVLAGLLAISLQSGLSRADDMSSNQSSDEDYEMEEIIITAQEPDWRKPKDEQDWRPKRFELPENDDKKRMEWFPEYTRDERSDYDGVRDRMNEKPDYKVFEWKF